MKLLIVLLSISLTPSVLSQSADKGKWEIQANGGMAIVGQFNSFNISEEPAAFVYTELNGAYFIQEKLSIGLSSRFHNFITSSADSETAGTIARGGAMHFTTKYNWLNNPRFNFYTGIGFGGSFINILGINHVSGLEGYAELRGNSYFLDCGFNWYLSDLIGLNMSLNYQTQNYRNTYLELDDEPVTSLNSAWTENNQIVHRGLALELGFSFKF